MTKRIPRVHALYNALFAHFGPQGWWPARSHWEMIVGAFLVQNTAWGNVELALGQLRRANSLSVHAIAGLPRSQLELLIRPAGFFRQKAERLQMFARLLQSDRPFWRHLIGRPRGVIAELRSRLLAHKGIGPETADSILLYAGAYPIFVVDAYTRRIGGRVGFLRTDDYPSIQNYFQSCLPVDPVLYNEYHALLVRLAKEHCRKTRPLCPTCPARTFCRYAQRKMR